MDAANGAELSTSFCPPNDNYLTAYQLFLVNTGVEVSGLFRDPDNFAAAKPDVTE